MLDEGREVESECFHHTRSEGLSASISSFRQGPKQCVCVCVSEWLCLCVHKSVLVRHCSPHTEPFEEGLCVCVCVCDRGEDREE